MLSTLTTVLPDQWTVTFERENGRGAGPDAVGRITGPDGQAAVLLVEVKRSLEGRNVAAVGAQLRSWADRLGVTGAVLIAAAPYLSPATQDVLSTNGLSYLDTTGNVSLRSSSPAIYVRTVGAIKDPWPTEDALQSLRGRGAARAVRALLDFRPPYGVRELAVRADVPLASLSRAIDLVERDNLLSRIPRGPITEVDWHALIRRWARDYDVARSNQVTTLLEPRGLAALTAKLTKLHKGYAATGALAAQQYAPVAPTRLAAIYATDAVALGDRLGLRPADAGANVWLIEPYDEVVFARTSRRDGLICVNPSQLAVDLLTGPGRDPSEGEELLAWMRGHEDAWRS
ncbi:MAG: hypothetical protein ACKV2O_06610 [Acidimicrobiales bacterium]